MDELEPKQAAIIRARYQYSATLEEAGRLCGPDGIRGTDKSRAKAIRRLRSWDYQGSAWRGFCQSTKKYTAMDCEEMAWNAFRGHGQSSTEGAALHLVE